MSQPKRPRRAPAAGYARGDETRQRIIDAAIKLFGEHGFAGASTRDIAAAAGVNPPALQYYFENKEGVYLACAQFITDDLLGRFEPAMRLAAAALKNHDSVQPLIDVFLHIYEVGLDMVLTDSQAADRRLFVARDMAGEEPLATSKLLEQRLKEPLNKLRLTLLARITGTSTRDPVTRIRLLTLKGQMMPFFHPPGACLEAMGWKEMDAAKATLLKATVIEQTRTLLESWRSK
ncbi:CerR family C-terminal domain-containing protein [Dyella telluris]|uniref:CerR family C-terminal domain-containing protein n=1 Tax=Dyella telluris TaxID=2763498 RepID=A0A7G8Q3Q0_9GAMM|nr:CerR family C-terminal domain-containing protein [Dyella telluris]QNK01408.1 CerR family C-terminal domain-containing protein [Dyella telluris]